MKSGSDREPANLRVLRASLRVPPLIGGQEIHVAELSKTLAGLGVEQTLLFADGAPEIPGVTMARLSVPSVPSYMVGEALFGARLAMYPSAEFHVVHTHGDAPIARGGAIAAFRLGASHVHTFHADLVPGGLRRSILRTLLPKRSWYLAVSHRVAASLAGAGAQPARIFVRTSGVRGEFFRTAAERRPDVVVGGRLIPAKRILEAVRSWAGTDTGGSRLLVFGAGPDAAAIQEIAERSENVVWLGELEVEALSRVLTTAAVGVVTGLLPSTRTSSEGTPTLVLEMLAAGCYPVVGPDTGEALRVIHDAQFGEVSSVAPSPVALADLAAKWSGEGMAPERARVRTLVEARFGWAAVAAEIKDFYERRSRLSTVDAGRD